MIFKKSYRVMSYRDIFNLKTDYVHRKQVLAVLDDLRRFCYADKSTIKINSSGVDPIAMAVAEGRREVWMRITAAMAASDEDVFNLIRAEESHGRSSSSSSD